MALTRVKTVDPTQGNAEYTTIQAAINAFPSNPDVRYTVLVYSGTYAENVTLDSTKENVDIIGVDRDGVVIAPSTGDGITCNEKNSIRNLTVKPTAGDGIILGDDCEISNVTVEAMGASKRGIPVGAKSNIRIENCKVKADSEGVTLGGGCDGVSVVGCEIRAGDMGARTNGGQNMLFLNCRIIGDAAINPTGGPWGFFVDSGGTEDAGTLLVQGCRIEATSQSSTAPRGVHFDVGGPGVRFVDCEISAKNTDSSSGGAHGFRAAAGVTAAKVIGGAITTSAEAAKETEVWDLLSEGADGWPAMSGTRCSKWKGPIKPAERPRPVIQRTLDVDDADSGAVLAETDLTGDEQKITEGITDPDVYRALSVRGNQAGMGQDVYIRGTDWAGNAICEKIALDGTATVRGLKPFKTVETIWLPAKSNGSQKVSVGTTSKLGLYYPISAASALIQQARKAPGPGSYAIMAVGTVDAVYSTVDVGIPPTPQEYSYEWAILTSS